MKAKPERFSDLSPRWKDFIRRMQRLNFGCFTNAKVESGEPSIDEQTRKITRFKFPGSNAPRPESRLNDFVLTAEVCTFVDIVKTLKDGRIPLIEFRHGLPFQMEVDDLS